VLSVISTTAGVSAVPFTTLSTFAVRLILGKCTISPAVAISGQRLVASKATLPKRRVVPSLAFTASLKISGTKIAINIPLSFNQ
jgi:hypothetical protein